MLKRVRGTSFERSRTSTQATHTRKKSEQPAQCPARRRHFACRASERSESKRPGIGEGGRLRPHLTLGRCACTLFDSPVPHAQRECNGQNITARRLVGHKLGTPEQIRNTLSLSL